MNCSTFADGRIMQIAYVTDDVEQSVRNFGRDFGIGGWVVVKDLAFENVLLRGQPCITKIAGGIAFQGGMMYEFIQPLDDAPSVYRDRYTNALLVGFYHVGRIVPDLQAAICGYEDGGYSRAMECHVVGGTQAAYLERVGSTTGMIELIEASPSVDQLIRSAEAVQAPWTGKVNITYW